MLTSRTNFGIHAVWTQIRLLLEEQSDQGPRYLLQRRLKRISRRHTADEDEIIAKNFDNRVHIFFNS